MEDPAEVEAEFCNMTGSAINCTGMELETIAEQESRPEAVAVPVTLGIILVIGLSSNILLLMFLSRKNRMKSPHCILLASLAISDLLMLAVGMPLVSTLYTLIQWPFGAFGCKLSEFVQSVAVASAIFNLTALSVDRFIAVALQDQNRRQRLTHGTVLGIWITASLVALPDLISSTTISFGDLQFCIVYPESFGETYQKVHVALKFTLLFALPLTIISVLYGLLVHCIMLARKQAFAAGSSVHFVPSDAGSSDKAKKQQARVTIVVLGLVNTFIVCWLPRHIFLLWFHFHPSDYNLFWHVFKMVGFCLMFLNSAINPIVYALLDNMFQTFIAARLCCKNRRYHETRETNDTSSSGPNQTVAMTVFIPNANDGEKL